METCLHLFFENQLYVVRSDSEYGNVFVSLFFLEHFQKSSDRKTYFDVIFNSWSYIYQFLNHFLTFWLNCIFLSSGNVGTHIFVKPFLSLLTAPISGALKVAISMTVCRVSNLNSSISKWVTLNWRSCLHKCSICFQYDWYRFDIRQCRTCEV